MKIAVTTAPVRPAQHDAARATARAVALRVRAVAAEPVGATASTVVATRYAPAPVRSSSPRVIRYAAVHPASVQMMLAMSARRTSRFLSNIGYPFAL